MLYGNVQVTFCVCVTVVNCLMDISFTLRLPSVKLFPLSYQIIPGVFPLSLYTFVLVSLWVQPSLWGKAVNILWYYFSFKCNNVQLISIACLFFVCYNTVWARHWMWLNIFRENMFSNIISSLLSENINDINMSIKIHALISFNIVFW